MVEEPAALFMTPPVRNSPYSLVRIGDMIGERRFWWGIAGSGVMHTSPVSVAGVGT